MENAIVPFLVLHLTISVQQRVLRNMDCIAQLLFSILSNRTKSLMRTLKVKASHVVLKFEIFVEIHLHFSDDAGLRLILGYGPGRRDIVSMEEAPKVTIVSDLNYWKRPAEKVRFGCDLIYREWVLHILDVYHDTHIRDFELSSGTDDYDINSIRTALRGIETPVLVVKRVDNEELLKNVARQFQSIKRVEIDDNRTRDKDRLQQVLMFDFDYIRVHAAYNPHFASLDRFLTINASSIVLTYSPTTDKMLNRFLKLWMRGAMPRLQRLAMDFRSARTLKKNVILDGVQYTERGYSQIKFGLFEERNGPKRMAVRGGLSLMRSDGTEATIKMYENGENVDDSALVPINSSYSK